MKKSLFILALCCLSAYANAVPNVWTSGRQMGFYGFILANTSNHTLSIQCNAGGDDHLGHGIYLMLDENNSDFSSDSLSTAQDGSQHLSFLIDDEFVINNHDFGSDTVDVFRKFASANKIEAFIKNQPVTTFYPTEKSRLSNMHIMETQCIQEIS